MADTQPWDGNLPTSLPANVHVPRPRTGDETYPAAPARVRSKRSSADREELRVNLLLGALALGSLTWSFVSYFQPFG